MTQEDRMSLGAAFLKHYGVKGMHWGERKAYESQAQRAYSEYAKTGRLGIDYVQREITESEYKTLSSAPIKISDKNGTFSRIVKDNSGQLRDGMAYVTRDSQDTTNYLALFPPEGNSGNRQKYLATIKVSQAVVSPGKKERVDTFISTLDKNVDSLDDGTIVKGRAFITGYADKNQEPPAIRALSNRELGLTYYQRWAQTQHVNDTLNQAYTKELIKKGYNAVIDDADAGMMSQTPIILFPKQADARIVEVTAITKDDELIARANIKAPKRVNV